MEPTQKHIEQAHTAVGAALSIVFTGAVCRMPRSKKSSRTP